MVVTAPAAASAAITACVHVRLEKTIERLESRTAAQVAISLLVIFTVVAVPISVMPDSAEVKKRVVGVTQPYLNAVGMDQNWGVFAPNPRREVVEIAATLKYPDGSSESWKVPDGGKALGHLWDYRWRKLAEWVVPYDADLYPGVARVAAGQRERRDATPTSVVLTRRTRVIGKPGTTHRYGPWKERQLSELPLPPGSIP